MDWTALLRLPSTVLLALAALALAWALVHVFKAWRRWRRHRRVAAGYHGLLLTLGVALALLLAGLGVSLHGYRFLGQEQPVIALDAQSVAPQRWAVTLTWPDGKRRTYAVAGDGFRVEAIVLKWQLPAVLAGVPPLYRLDRLEGRYRDVRQEASAPRSVADLREPARFDWFDLAGKYPRWLLQVDTVYGSGAYLPLVAEGHYTIRLMRTGALVARADPATRKQIEQLPQRAPNW